MTSLRRLCLAPLFAVITCAGCGTADAVSSDVHQSPADLVVRVDQAGYPAGEAKTAFVMSAGSLPSKAEVFDASGHRVLDVDVGPDLGAWNDRYRHVGALDLGPLATPGTYSVRALGVSSPPFPVDAPAALYTPLLDNAAFFYRVQRDGSDVDPDALGRRPSHLADVSAHVFQPPSYADDVLEGDLVEIGDLVDVEGGWFDAGDYLKFVDTTSYVEAVMLVALRDHAATVGAAGFEVEAKRGVSWLRKMWNDPSETLYYQVGIGDGNDQVAGDHDPWRLPEADDELVVEPGDANFFLKHRPVFRAGAAGSLVSPNLAGRLAADFGLCAQVYRASDAALADACLVAGAHLFDLADTSPAELLTVSPHDYYPESSWTDDLELGAAELALAVRAAGAAAMAIPHDATYYLGQAAHWAAAYMQNDSGSDSLNLYDVSALAHRELARALDGGAPLDTEVTKADLVGDLRDQLAAAEDQAKADPFGLGIGYGEADATPHAFGLALTADFYAELGGGDAFAALGRAQRHWVFGQNAWGASFVVGAGSAFPRCLHHQIANLAGSLDGSGAILLGAAVDGPAAPSDFDGLEPEASMRPCPAPGAADAFAPFATPQAHYRDASFAWPSVEPAIDYTALAILLFARRIDG